MNQNPFVELLAELRNCVKEPGALLIAPEASEKLCVKICQNNKGVYYPLDNSELSFSGYGIMMKSEAFQKLNKQDPNRYLLSTFKLFQFTYRTTVEFIYYDIDHGVRRNSFDAIIDNQLTGTRVKVVKLPKS